MPNNMAQNINIKTSIDKDCILPLHKTRFSELFFSNHNKYNETQNTKEKIHKSKNKINNKTINRLNSVFS